MVGYDRETRDSFSSQRGFDSFRDSDRRDTRGYATDRRRDLDDLQRFEDDGGRTYGRESSGREYGSREYGGRDYDREMRSRRRDAEPIDPRGYGNAGGSEAGWSGYGNAGRSDSYRMDSSREGGERSHPGSYEFNPGSRYGRMDRESWGSRDGDRAESWSYGSGGSASPYRRDEGPGYSGRGNSGYGYGSGFGGSSASHFGVPGSYGTGFGNSYGNTGFGTGTNPNYGPWPASSRERPWAEYGAREWQRGSDSGSQREGYGESRFGSRDVEGHRGKGPKGYTRSDTRIEEDVNDCLTEDPNIDASTIEVSVKSGEVTLSGTVSRREDKRRAEDAVERVSGVNHVQNNLRVKREDATSSGGMSGSTQSSTSSMGSEKRSGSESSSRATGGGISKSI